MIAGRPAEADARALDDAAKSALLQKQQQANEHLILASLRFQEMAEQAAANQAIAELAAEELREVERLLRAAADFSEQFLGMVGHDLRNPLSAILMAALLLQRHGRLDAEDTALVALMQKSGDRMSRMLTHLLDFTRVRLGGGLVLKVEQSDLRAICAVVADELRLSPKVQLLCTFEGDVTGRWDADRLAEVFSNIVGNAIEHAIPGTPVLLWARDAGRGVLVEISNQGASIPAELLPYIMEPFRRGRPAERSATGNLGLGLYIAKEIVLAHGGTIEARSADGTTTFAILLPRDARAP